MAERSSVVTADSGRVSSQSTIKSPDKPEKVKKKKLKNMVVCRITLLDGSQFEPAGVDKNCTGQIVFEKVTKHLDVLETDYFGLTYRDKTGKKFWLDNTKKVSKVVQGGTWVFEFQVKFYPPDPMSLKEDITRYQLCLQLRVDIFNGRLPCSFVTCALLGSYTVQAELGDWEPPGDNHPTGYLNDFDFSPVQNQELLDKICELHKHHKGQTPTVAEAHFLENAKKLAMYGVDMHDTKDQENKDIQLGVCSTGVLVYKDRLRINRFVWPRILKMSYKGNNFYIKIRPNEFDPHEKTIGFKCENHKLAKRLWKTCVEHHAFFRLKDADAPSSTAFPRFNTKFRYSGRTAAQARKAAEMADREEPHITRTAERKSLNYGHNKSPMLDEMEQKMLADERDKLGQQDDSNATAEYDPSYAGFDHNGRSRALDDDQIKQNYMRLLRETPTIHSQSRWPEARQEIDRDPRFTAVPLEALREEWFNEYVNDLVKEEYKQLLRDTPGITTTSKYSDVKPHISNDPRYAAVPSEALREQWFKEYTDDLVKEDYKELLWETPDITDKSKFGDVKGKIKNDPRYKAVPSDKLREEWFNEFKDDEIKPNYMRMLRDTPEIHSQSRWPEARKEIERDPRFSAVPKEALREAWFNEHVNDLLKDEYKHMLRDTPGITSTTKYSDVKPQISNDPRYQAVPSEALREKWFKEYTDDMMKEEYMQLLRETPDISGKSKFGDVKGKIKNDPRYKAVPSDKLREEWFNEYKNDLLKQEYKQLLWENPGITPTTRYDDAKPILKNEPRYKAVPTDEQREDWFEEYKNDRLKDDYKQLLRETPGITSKTRFDDVKYKIGHDPRYKAVPNDGLRHNWFHEYRKDLGKGREGSLEDAADASNAMVMEQLKEDYTQLLRETPDVTSTSRLGDVTHKISHDPRYQAVPNDDLREDWFNEYTDDLLKQNYMRLLRETPQITSQSTWQEARQEIDLDPRFQAVPTEAMRENWCNEYVHNLLKSEFMQMLKETPAIHSQSRWEGVKEYVEDDRRYKAVRSSTQREDWFDEYIQNLKKEDFMKLLRETPDITSYSRYNDVKDELRHDPRFQNVDTEAQREVYFKEHVQDLKKTGFVQLLVDTPEITAYSCWPQSKPLIDTDPRYHAVDTDLQRAKWFNEYVNNLAGLGDCAFGMRVGDYKSIDRTQEFLPLIEPSVTKKKTEETMPFFEPAGDANKRKPPPPIPRKPKPQEGEEDRQMRSSVTSSTVPVTVTTETYKFNPDMEDTPRSTSNIPIVETKTHKVTYEKDGIPYETEDSILISAHSVTTKSQTIDTTTYKTERDGVVETRVERKVTVTSDDEDLDHDLLLRLAIQEVTNMNQGLEVEKIECVKQIEEVNG